MRDETERDQGEILTREEFDAALSEVGMHLSGRYERMLSAHDLALRCQRDRLVRALLDHACDCGPMDPDPTEHRETCPFRQALEAVEGGGDDDLPPPWGEGVEPDEADRRAFGRLLEENTNLAQEVRKVYDDALSEERPGGSGELRIVFDGPPPSPEFVEVENADGESIRAGEWHERGDGLWELRLRRSTPDASREELVKIARDHMPATVGFGEYTWDEQAEKIVDEILERLDHPAPDEEADDE